MAVYNLDIIKILCVLEFLSWGEEVWLIMYVQYILSLASAHISLSFLVDKFLLVSTAIISFHSRAVVQSDSQVARVTVHASYGK